MIKILEDQEVFYNHILKGFGFALYKNVESADKVMKEKNSHNINGKWIDCKRAQPKEMVADSPLNNNTFMSKFEYLFK